jgi:hypothetical protein
MNEAITIDIAAAKQSRIKIEEDIARQEKRTKDYYLHDSIAWLKVADEQREEDLERLSSKRHKGTCEWVTKDPLFQAWKDDGHSDPILWVKGIPGAGGRKAPSSLLGQLTRSRENHSEYLCHQPVGK